MTAATGLLIDQSFYRGVGSYKSEIFIRYKRSPA